VQSIRGLFCSAVPAFASKSDDAGAWCGEPRPAEPPCADGWTETALSQGQNENQLQISIDHAEQSIIQNQNDDAAAPKFDQIDGGTGLFL